jgi:hypothetical protein
MYVCMLEHPNRFEKNRETQLSREKEKLYVTVWFT